MNDSSCEFDPEDPLLRRLMDAGRTEKAKPEVFGRTLNALGLAAAAASSAKAAAAGAGTAAAAPAVGGAAGAGAFSMAGTTGPAAKTAGPHQVVVSRLRSGDRNFGGVGRSAPNRGARDAKSGHGRSVARTTTCDFDDKANTAA
jgi:hypothetical protein